MNVGPVNAIIQNEKFRKLCIFLASKGVNWIIKTHKQNNDYYQKRKEQLSEERNKIYQNRIDALNQDRERYYALLINAETQEEKEKYSTLYLEANAKLSFTFDEADQTAKENIEKLERKEKHGSESNIKGLVLFNMLLPGLGTLAYFKFKKKRIQKSNKKEEDK